MAMLVDERRNRLLEMVRVRRFASLPDLAEQLAVSESTVRRDLDVLEEQGNARRIHGGVFYTGNAPKFVHFDSRQSGQFAAKQAIARAAASLVQDGDTIALDAGSTAYEVARLLVGRPLLVLTNSLPVANLFASDINSDLVFVGGNICPRSGTARGPYANAILEQVRVRKAFLGVAAVNHEGFFNDDLLGVETQRALIRAADVTTIVAHSTKFGRSSLAHLCSLGGVARVIVDSGISEPWPAKMREAGVEVIIAETNPTTPS